MLYAQFGAVHRLCRLFFIGGDDYLSGNFEGIKTQKFGVEIECAVLTREDAAEAVAKVLGGSPDYFGGSYDRCDIYDSQDRL